MEIHEGDDPVAISRAVSSQPTHYVSPMAPQHALLCTRPAPETPGPVDA